MKKHALAISVALVLGVSASALAGTSFKGSVDPYVVNQWSTATSANKTGDTAPSTLQLDMNFRFTNSEKNKAWRYEGDFNKDGYINNDGTAGINVYRYLAEVKDPMFTLAVWGKEYSYTEVSDYFGWVQSPKNVGTANSASSNQKARLVTAKGAAIDFDNNDKTIQLNYATKVGTADVGMAAATIAKGSLVRPTNTEVFFGKKEVAPGVTVQGEIGITNGESRKFSEIGANGAAAAKVDYKVSDALSTSAWASARGQNFTEFSTDIFEDDYAEYGASANYVQGVMTYSLSLAKAKSTAAVDQDAKKYNTDATSSVSVKYAPEKGLKANASYEVVTQDMRDAADTGAKHTFSASASDKFLADKLSVSANYKVIQDEDAFDPGNFNDAFGSNKFTQKVYDWFSDANVTASYNFDDNTSATGTLQYLGLKWNEIEDSYVREYAKLSRKVAGATVNLEWTSTVRDMVRDADDTANPKKFLKYDAVPLVQETQTKLSMSIPF